MNACTQRLLDALESHGCRPSKNGHGYKAHCPAHEDRRESLAIDEGEGLALVWCHAGCKFKEIVESLGLKQSDLFPPSPSRNGRRMVAEYDYCDEEGTLLFQSVRYEPKDFSQRRPDGSGGWIWDLKGVRRVLYRLPEMLKGDLARVVFVVEGEKSVERLRDLGLVATCSPMGAGKWTKVDDSPLHGRRVIILPDNDVVGRNHAADVVASLSCKATVVMVLDLPGLLEHGDVCDWLDAGGTAEQLKQRARAVL